MPKKILKKSFRRLQILPLSTSIVNFDKTVSNQKEASNVDGIATSAFH